MKPQDLIFIAFLLLLIFLRKPKFLVGLGILLLALSIPLFEFQVFFTAQRLVMYAAAFFLIAIIFMLFELRGEK